jgi:branched-chain amino acid transport system substrate-binding protein
MGGLCRSEQEKTLMRMRLLTLCAAALLALGLGAAGADEPVEFRIGVVASVTGPFAAPTKDTFDGFNAWIKQRGLGRKIVLQTLDDETNPVNAANAFRRLASDPQIALIYLFINSNSAMAAKSFASEFKVPIITGGGADVLGVPPDPWMFKVAPSNRDYMIALSEYIKRNGYTKVAHLYSTDTFGQYDHTNLQTLAPQYRYKLVAEESFAIEDTSFNAQLTRIRAANPDLIYSSASARAAILAFKQYRQLGLTTPLVVAGSAISEAFFNAIGGPAAADGLMMMTQRGSLGEGLGGEAATYHAELKEGLGGRTPVFFNVFGFDVGLITAAAVQQSDGSRQGIRDALEKLKDLPAINGPVTYTPQDHTGQDSRSIALGRLENGKPVPAD